MAEQRRWGRAGVRLTPQEAAARDAAAWATRHRAEAATTASNERTYRRWRQGLVVPWRITAALDLRSLHGPAVDPRCRAHEPEVDQWETGERYPRWDQVWALANLTGFAPEWFVMDGHPPMPLWDTSMWHHMKAEERRAYERDYRPPVVRYPRAVLDARQPSPERMPHPDEFGPVPAPDGLLF